MGVSGFEIDDFSMVLNDGFDIDMTKICGCEDAHTIDSCEENCPRYYSCYNIALAHDILAAYENAKH